MKSARDILNIRWLVPLLAAFLTMHCAPVEEAWDQGWNCPGQDLKEGRYSFTVDKVDDKCGVEQLDATMLGTYAPVELPGFGSLPAQTTMELPLLGSKVVTLWVNGETVEVSLVGEEEAVVDLGDCQLRFHLSGVLCPATEHEIDVNMRFTFLDVDELTPGACEGFSLESGCTVTASSKCRHCL